jgi:hypothetical protein
MTAHLNYQLALEDLLADLHFARKNGQLGRLALLAYCDVKRWARQAGKPDVADTALRMFSEIPCINRADFLYSIDQLVTMLELHQRQYQRGNARIPVTFSSGQGVGVQQ